MWSLINHSSDVTPKCNLRPPPQLVFKCLNSSINTLNKLPTIQSDLEDGHLLSICWDGIKNTSNYAEFIMEILASETVVEIRSALSELCLIDLSPYGLWEWLSRLKSYPVATSRDIASYKISVEVIPLSWRESCWSVGSAAFCHQVPRLCSPAVLLFSLAVTWLWESANTDRCWRPGASKGLWSLACHLFHLAASMAQAFR